MAETLGMLCDKLTIVKLKQYHTTDEKRQESLTKQAILLQQEIDGYVSAAINGLIPLQNLTFASNKVYKKEGNEIEEKSGDLGELFSQLADINCKLWHEVEKGYDIENIPVYEKDHLIKSLAVLNLERNMVIDKIDITFCGLIANQKINE